MQTSKLGLTAHYHNLVINTVLPKLVLRIGIENFFLLALEYNRLAKDVRVLRYSTKTIINNNTTNQTTKIKQTTTNQTTKKEVNYYESKN